MSSSSNAPDCWCCCCCCFGPKSRYDQFDNEPEVVTQQPAPQHSSYGSSGTTEELKNLQERGKINEKNIKFLEIQLKKKDDKLGELEQRLADADQVRQTNEDLRKRLSEAGMEIQEMKQTNRNLETKLTNADKELQAMRQTNEELRTRLSAVMGAKVTNDNPNIADLSDANRPTKLADQFSELYDNAWTDLYENLTGSGNMTDKGAVAAILNVFQAIYDLCQTKAAADLQNLQSYLKNFVDEDDVELLKHVKDERKKNYLGQIAKMRSDESFVQHVDQIMFDSFADERGHCEKFIDESIQLCWLMAIQDPPVCLIDWKGLQGQPFDSSVFRHYTKAGKVIDFVVWPALLLHAGGNILTRGVAQAEDDDDYRQTAGTTDGSPVDSVTADGSSTVPIKEQTSQDECNTIEQNTNLEEIQKE